jgi:histone H3/H4
MAPKLSEVTVKRIAKSGDRHARTSEDATGALMDEVNAYLDDLAHASKVAVEAAKLQTVTTSVLKAVLSRPVHGFTLDHPSSILAATQAAESQDSKGKKHRGVSLAYVKARVAKTQGLRCGKEASIVLQNAATAYMDAIVARARDFTEHSKRKTLTADDVKAGMKHIC